MGSPLDIKQVSTLTVMLFELTLTRIGLEVGLSGLDAAKTKTFSE